MNKASDKKIDSPQALGKEADFRLYLQGELLRRCEKNPAYSLRSFARSLNTDVATLSKLLKGQRSLGRLTIERLGRRLGLAPEEIQRFLMQRKNQKAGGKKRWDEVGPDYQQLSLDSFRIISDWYHYGLLELMRLDHFRTDRRWIARSLGITAGELNIAIERLQRLGILEITAEGRWIDHSNGRSTTVGNAFTADAFRKLQRQILEKALKALEEVPMTQRDHSSMTMAIDSSRLGEAKERIKQFRRELAGFMSRGGGPLDSVYQLSISLFPSVTPGSRTPNEKSTPETGEAENETK